MTLDPLGLDSAHQSTGQHPDPLGLGAAAPPSPAATPTFSSLSPQTLAAAQKHFGTALAPALTPAPTPAPSPVSDVDRIEQQANEKFAAEHPVMSAVHDYLTKSRFSPLPAAKGILEGGVSLVGGARDFAVNHMLAPDPDFPASHAGSDFAGEFNQAVERSAPTASSLFNNATEGAGKMVVPMMGAAVAPETLPASFGLQTYGQAGEEVAGRHDLTPDQIEARRTGMGLISAALGAILPSATHYFAQPISRALPEILPDVANRVISNTAGNALEQSILQPAVNTANNAVALATRTAAPGQTLTTGNAEARNQGIVQSPGFGAALSAGEGGAEKISPTSERVASIMGMPAEKVTVLPRPPSTPAGIAADSIARISGQAPVWYRADHPANGFYDPQTQRIHLNAARPGDALAAAAGHEVAHSLEDQAPALLKFAKDNPDLVMRGANTYVANAKGAGLDNVAAGVEASPARQQSEGVATIAEEILRNPDVQQRLAKQNPSLLARIVQTVKDIPAAIAGNYPNRARQAERQMDFIKALSEHGESVAEQLQPLSDQQQIQSDEALLDRIDPQLTEAAREDRARTPRLQPQLQDPQKLAEENYVADQVASWNRDQRAMEDENRQVDQLQRQREKMGQQQKLLDQEHAPLREDAEATAEENKIRGQRAVANAAAATPLATDGEGEPRFTPAELHQLLVEHGDSHEQAAETVARLEAQRATTQGQQPENNLSEHQGADKERSGSETGGGDRVPGGGEVPGAEEIKPQRLRLTLAARLPDGRVISDPSAGTHGDLFEGGRVTDGAEMGFVDPKSGEFLDREQAARAVSAPVKKLHSTTLEGMPAGGFKPLMSEEEISRAWGDSSPQPDDKTQSGRPPTVNAPVTSPEDSSNKSSPLEHGSQIPGNETLGQTSSNDRAAVTADNNVPTSRQPVKRTGKPYSKASLEKAILEHYDRFEGSAREGQALQDERNAENESAASPTTWKRQDTPTGYPREITDAFTDEELRELRRRGIIRLAPERSGSGGGQHEGEDAMHAMGVDRYNEMLRRRLQNTKGDELDRAIEFAKKSGDPRMQFLAALHENTPPTIERPKTQPTDPATIKTGGRFKLYGSDFEVVLDHDGTRVLKDGEEYPVVPVDWLAGEKLPIDKGSLKGPAREAGKAPRLPAPGDDIPFSVAPASGDAERDRAEKDLASLRDVRGSTDAALTARREFINKPLVNRETGMEATVSNSSLGKLLSKSARDDSISPQAHAAAVANIDKLFAAAIPRESRPDRDGSTDIAQIHHFEVPMPFDGQMLRAKIMVKEMAQRDQGRRVYLVNAVEIKKPASSFRVDSTSADEGSRRSPVPPAGFSDNFNALADRVKQHLANTPGEDQARFSVAPSSNKSIAKAEENSPVGEDEKSGPIARLMDHVRSTAQTLRDYFTIDPIPKLHRLGGDVADHAVQHASARIATQHIVNDLIAQILPAHYNDEKVTSALADAIMKNRILGGYDKFDRFARNYAARAQEADGGQGDRGLYGPVSSERATVLMNEAQRYRQLRDEIARKHPITHYDLDVRKAMSDPVLGPAINRYVSVVDPILDNLLREVKGVDADANVPRQGRHFDAYAPLMPDADPRESVEAAEPEVRNQVPAANVLNAQVKRDKFDRPALYTQAFSKDLPALLSAVVGPRWNEATKIRFIKSLIDSGAAVLPGKDDPIPTQIDGQPVRQHVVSLPETDAEGKTRLPPRNIYIRGDVYRDFRNVIETDMKPESNPLFRPLTMLQLAQVSDAITHAKNITSVVTHAQGAGSAWADAVRKIPGLASGDAVRRIYQAAAEVRADTPAIRAEIADMAKRGFIRPDYPSTGIQKITHAQEWLHQWDTAGRIVMNRFYDELVRRGVPAGTEEDRRNFINQVGQYNYRLMSSLDRGAKWSGLSPFLTAGRNFNRIGRRAVLGDPGFEPAQGHALKARALQLIGPVLAIGAIPMMLNSITTGNPMGRSGTPLGAWDLGKDDENGNHRVIDLLQGIGMRRGLRSMGIDALEQGLRDGKDANTILHEMRDDMLNSALHPFMGPAPGFIAASVTGRRFDLRGKMDAHRIPEGGSRQDLENLRAALQSQNQLVYSMTKPLFAKAGLDETDGGGVGGYLKDVGATLIKSPDQAFGVKSVMAGTDSAEDLAQHLASRGDDGVTFDDEKKIALKRQLGAQLKSNPDSAKKNIADAIDAGKLTPREAANLATKAGQSALEWHVRSLTPADSMLVWNKATDAEKKEILPAISQKLIRSQSIQSEMKQEDLQRLLGDADRLDPEQASRMRFEAEYQELHDRASGKQAAAKLTREAYQARSAGLSDKAEQLTAQAQELRQKSTLSAEDQDRYDRLQSIHRSVDGIERQIKDGTIEEDQASGAIRQLMERYRGVVAQ